MSTREQNQPDSTTSAGDAKDSPARPARLTSIILGVTALAVFVLGAMLVVEIVNERPVQEATVAGLFLRLDHAEWLDDQMEHNERYPMPASMMPDLPPHGVFRLSVEVALHNPTESALEFRVSELFFRSSERGLWPASGGELSQVRLDPGRAINLFTHFDIADSEIEGDLRLLWFRDATVVQMLDVPHPPDHFHEDDERGGLEWPERVEALPPGNPMAGETLFLQTYGCISCHGHPEMPNSHTIGPHLGRIGELADTRVPGKSATQYLYESLLDPDAFVAPDCKIQPCQSPSVMPPFGELLRLQEMSDLLAYLLTRKS